MSQAVIPKGILFSAPETYYPPDKTLVPTPLLALAALQL